MKKIYILLLACTVITCVNAQVHGIIKRVHPSRNITRPITEGLAGGCDTLNLALLNDTSAYSPVLYNPDPYYGFGYFTGVNTYGTLGNAQYFDASALTDTYITQAYVYFGAGSNTDTTKTIPVNIYDGTNGTVGAILGSTTLTMGTIATDVDSGYFTQVVFNPAIQLPASKLFFVGVDYSNLSYSVSQFDSLAIVSTLFGQSTGTWEDVNPSFFTYSGWNSDLNFWGFDLGLYIFPLLSTSPICSSSLPVHLISFTGQTKGSNVLLNWQVTQELNMKEYGVERAGSNLQFSTVGTVPATNSPLEHAYSYTDEGALAATTGDLYYRLRQVNSDGSITYSNVIKIAVANGTFTARIVNPFSNMLQMHINSPVAQKLQATVYDVQGRKVAELGVQQLSLGDNFITLPTGQLAKGIYILNLAAGNDVYKYKILNQ